ncbi:AAA domain-containing protein [Spartinivicinus poritis]|uniref:AAA domain-containing protein n=1 Tax=Spartinivicinus poritis TaxID=2994640 RepID=A0ABT5UCZ1_9GAMM|nr:AAA domain-containing protein [Spartinivicinus sp. A2-2]MDE1464241.1 AAA domain-containing protein [Spartinivicinus sp. A2-2]
MRFLTNKNIEQGVSAKYDRKNRFVVKRYKTKAGSFVYLLTNSSNNDRLAIPHYLMDRFRALLVKLHKKMESVAAQDIEIDEKLYFKDTEYYRFEYTANTLEHLTIVDLNSAGRFNIYREAVNTVVELLYDAGLDHPNGVFDRIIDYHKLFQFTFNEGSESITSGLSVRRNTLIEMGDYIPLEKDAQNHVISVTTDPTSFENGLTQKNSGIKKTADTKNLEFKRKLGERNTEENHTVDYDTLFGASSAKKAKRPVKNKARLPSVKITKTSCPLPLLAGDIKSHTAKVYKCELTSEDASSLRKGVLADRDAEHLLGFEIFTAIFKKNGKLKSFSFPLYYMNVKVEESGRFLHVYPPENGDVYLNHLSLSVFIENFSDSKKSEPLDSFFNTLLSQKIEIDKKLHNISIRRQLPYSEDVFRQTREILIGKRGENGKGGIIENLNIIGIECDLGSVVLYRAERNPSPLTRALDLDLKKIQRTAHEYPHRFYASLLGKFLNPELKTNNINVEEFCSTPLSPGTLTKSSKALIQNLNDHNFVLLEGPPGTGKTFTIRNLLIHCLNSNKKLLIVSDQQAAIHALNEKIQEYLVGKDVASVTAVKTMNLWKSAIKVIDEVPSSTDDLGLWINKLSKMLAMDLSREQDWPHDNPKILEDIRKLDAEYQEVKENIGRVLNKSFELVNRKSQIIPKNLHPSNHDDISDLTAFLTFIGSGDLSKANKSVSYRKHLALASKFIELRREMLNSNYASCYPDFEFRMESINELESVVSGHINILQLLIKEKPKTEDEFFNLFQTEVESYINSFLVDYWTKCFGAISTGSVTLKIQAVLKHPCISVWKSLLKQLLFHQDFITIVKSCENPDQVLRQFNQIHHFLDPNQVEVEHCLAFDICQYFLSGYREVSINYQLEQLTKIQQKRDMLIKEMCLLKLTSISKKAIANRQNSTNRATKIINLVESLKSCNTIDTGSGASILKELQEELWECFPIWICRKQAVPFLFPSKENMIDLVVVDEAGQCRVDDALPLLYRAKKLMVVGDDKQTVFNKNSIIDDYLFREAELEEHLRSIQARGVKGGGSNLFELVKSIKQGGVLLDEHYRCPPAIIAYSNEYVYNNDLKIMQWQLPSSTPSVVVDYGEKIATSNKKTTNWKYKGIEVEMVDRFFSYIVKTIKKIEKETKRTINVETDVAICYFLLKNEPYIKDNKSKLLVKLDRGRDVLDGAGAALQGKERDYIFYYWDISSSNLASFRQGDDPDKRKGELNVLMSRPKVRAYHYLHRNFETLNHGSTTITNYLWNTYRSQNKRSTKVRSNNNYIWTDSTSGHSIIAILSHLWSCRSIPAVDAYEPYFNIVIGNPKQKVDLMLVPKNDTKSSSTDKSIAVVDLSAFKMSDNSVDDVVDYYFQLQRAVPRVDPVFTFIHEIADERSGAYQQIEKKILAEVPSRKWP